MERDQFAKMEAKQEEGIWEKIIRNSLDIICTTDINGCFTQLNDACKTVLGYSKEELLGRPMHELIHPDDLAASLKATSAVVSGVKAYNFENRYLHKQGHTVHILWSAAWSEEEEVVVKIGRDITQLKLLRQQEALQKILVEYGANTLAMFDEQLNYLYSGGAIFKEMGYQPQELIGKSIMDLIHPEDVPLVKKALLTVLQSQKHLVVPQLRVKDAWGCWRWIETIVSNQLQNPEVKALVTTSRDVTERVYDKIKLQESQQKFKSLFDNHLDIVLFQNREGIIVDVNNTTLSFFGMTREQLTDRPFTDFLTPALTPVCTSALESALQGEWVRYQISIPFEGMGTLTFDISKIPVLVNGEVIGAYSILRDITDIHHSGKTIEKQAKKLNTILESITDAFFTLDKQWNFTYINAEFEKLFSISKESLLDQNYWSVVAPHSNAAVFKAGYQEAIETEKAVRFEVYCDLCHIWLQVKAFPSDDGLSVFLEDITEKVKARQELEKLSLVASKTTNGVVITDAAGCIEWVNEGFTTLTGYTLAEVVGRKPATFLLGDETDKAAIERYQQKRFLGIPFQEELLHYTKGGEKIWILLDISPVFNDAGTIVRYVAIQTDISERKEAEASQLQLTKDLYRQNQDLQQFTYIVSHNLRSPVANVLGLTEVLPMLEAQPDTFRLSLDYLKKSARQLDTVLTDLNTILAIREKKNSIDQERIPLRLVCQQALDDLKESFEACGGEVKLQIDEQLHVKGDKAYLYSVFHNLLSNAIKYRSQERSLKVNIRCLGSTENGTLVTLSDNGSGFDMQLAGDKLFKLYKRFHTSSEGRGIGLFLVKTHLAAMDGHIEVSSEVNVGTRFIIYLK